jgi:hypothetical protein
MRYYTSIEAAVMAATLRQARRSRVGAVLTGFAWGVLAALALLALVGCYEPAPTPEADYWLNRVGQVVDAESSERIVGIHVNSGVPAWVGAPEFDTSVALAVQAVEIVCGQLPAPVVTVWAPGTIDCGGIPAAGCYVHARDESPAYILLATDWTKADGTTLHMQSVHGTALVHELCHHASGLADSECFSLLVRQAKGLFVTLLAAQAEMVY